MISELSNNTYDSINSEDPIIFLQLPDTGGLAYCEALNLTYNKDYLYTDYHSMLEHIITFNKKAYAGYFNLMYKFYEDVRHPFNHVLLLRHPYDRFLATYYAIISNENHEFYELFIDNPLNKICDTPGLLALFRNDLLVNTISSTRVKERPCSATQRAKVNISNFFTIFGFSDKFEELLEISKFNFKWLELDYSGLNSVFETPKIELSGYTQNKIYEFLKNDMEIYNHAEKVYEERLPFLLPPKPVYFDMARESIFTKIWNKIKKIF